MEILKELYKAQNGAHPKSITKLSGDGSNRCYYRLSSENTSYIGVAGVSKDENTAFISIANTFKECGIDAPRVIKVSQDSMHYLLEDLGDDTLFSILKESRECGVFSEEDCKKLCSVMSLLADIQFKVGEKLDFNVCYPIAEFDKVSVFWDLNYFKYCFVKNTGIEIDEPRLEKEFETLSCLLLKENDNTFLYRDFQSRNIMWHNDKPYFIDFQGGRRGPIYYDVASFVGQTRAKYSSEVCDKMIDAYLESLSKYRCVDRVSVIERLNIFRILVIAMVLFGALTKVEVVWNLADVFMGLMAVINLVAIALLGKYAFIALDDYTAQKKAGIKNPVFDSSNIKGLEKVECWNGNSSEEKIG